MPTETRKLVKAMFRAEECLPEGLLCCSSLRERYEKHRGVQFSADMNTLRKAKCECIFCGAQFGTVTFVTLINRAEYKNDVWIQTLDLCEGDYAEAVEARN